MLMFFYLGSRGGIGRRKGLKILSGFFDKWQFLRILRLTTIELNVFNENGVVKPVAKSSHSKLTTQDRI